MVKDRARVRARVAALFPKAGHLSQKRIDAIADRLESTDESTDEEIDAELTEINNKGVDSLEDIAKNDDRIATLEKKSKKSEDPKKEEEEPEDDKDPVAKLTKQVAALAAQLEKQESEKSKQSLAERFKKDDRLKGIPEFMLKRSVPADEDSYEEAVASLSEEYKAFATEQKLPAFGNDAPPAGEGGGRGTKKEASDAEVDDIANKLFA